MPGSRDCLSEKIIDYVVGELKMADSILILCCRHRFFSLLSPDIYDIRCIYDVLQEFRRDYHSEKRILMYLQSCLEFDNPERGFSETLRTKILPPIIKGVKELIAAEKEKLENESARAVLLKHTT